MAKTQEELNKLKQEYDALNNKLIELTDEELEQVCAGGIIWDIAVKLKEKFNNTIINNSQGNINKQTSIHWDEASPELIIDPKDQQ